MQIKEESKSYTYLGGVGWKKGYLHCRVKASCIFRFKRSLAFCLAWNQTRHDSYHLLNSLDVEIIHVFFTD